MNKTNNGIIRVRTHPREDGSGNDDPHVKKQSIIQDRSHSVEKIADDEHGAPLNR
jgi:hypothetical protein